MKRISFFLCLLLLAGCSNNGSNDDVPQIEDHVWQMTTVQSAEAEGQAVAYGPAGDSTLDTAFEILMDCKAEDGVLTLVDETNAQTYSGSYVLAETDQQTARYDVVFDEVEGAAVVSMTTYHDGSQVPTLIIRLDDYALNFFPET